MSSQDQALVEALRVAGHETAADSLRDKHLADQLKAAGHDDVAGVLEQRRTKPDSDNPEPQPTEAKTDGNLVEADAAAVVDALQRDTDWSPASDEEQGR